MKTPIDQFIEKMEQFKEKFDQDPLFNRVINTCIYEAKLIQDQSKEQSPPEQIKENLNQTIERAKPNMDKIKNVDEFINSIR